MKREQKMAAVILAVMLLGTILFSYLFIMENAHHDCTGSDCPICMEMEAAMQTISGIKMLPVLPLILAVLCVFTQTCTEAAESNRGRDTLITLKVELLN